MGHKQMNDIQIGGDHYKGDHQHWDFTWEHGYNQFEYCMSKYVVRYPKKNGLQDLQKALHHAEKYWEVTDGHPKDYMYERDLREVIEFAQANDCNTMQELALALLHGGQIKDLIIQIKLMIDLYEPEVPREYVNPDVDQGVK
jgi:hypothetical protein